MKFTQLFIYAARSKTRRSDDRIKYPKCSVGLWATSRRETDLDVVGYEPSERDDHHDNEDDSDDCNGELSGLFLFPRQRARLQAILVCSITSRMS